MNFIESTYKGTLQLTNSKLRMKVQFIILITSVILVSSCSYRMVTMKDTDGVEHTFREYETLEENLEYAFNYHYKPQVYNRYTGLISSGEDRGFPHIQFDSIRVGFGPEARQYMPIFSSGILNSTIIYCNEDTSCKPCRRGIIEIDPKTRKEIPHDRSKGYSHYINIGEIQEPENLKESPQRRRFKLWINCTGGHGYSYYIIELTNPTVDEYVDIKSFVQSARLTFLMSFCCEI